MFSSVGISAKQPMQEVITASRAWVAPAGVSIVDMEGYGARGTDATSPYAFYYETEIVYGYRRDNGAKVFIFAGPRTYRDGVAPAPYCNEKIYQGVGDSEYEYTEICYTFDGQVNSPGQSAQTGASSTGLSKSFPGTLGGTTPHPQTITKFDGVAVTPGQSYNIVVPSSGSITIKYYN